MHITELKLHNFRNYERASLTLGGGITVFWGDNAQGKTNLLEAVYLCCVGRSHRTARDGELIRQGADGARVSLIAERRDGAHDVDIQLAPGAKKRLRVSGQTLARSGELMGHVSSVLFSPEDLRIVKDGPSERRRFIDMELSQIKPSYYYALQRYGRALKQRAHVLRKGELSGAMKETLDEWDELLAESGADIIVNRRAFITRLSAIAAEVHGEIAADGTAFRIEYRTIASGDADKPALKDALRKKLYAARNEDLRRGFTSIGPHRDELSLTLGGQDLKTFGSQGQHRTAALAMKLSELTVMREEMGEWPALLLDDVMSELDPNRRRQLLKAQSEVQTIVTCTDLSDLSGAPVSAIYRIVNGNAYLNEK